MTGATTGGLQVAMYRKCHIFWLYLVFRRNSRHHQLIIVVISTKLLSEPSIIRVSIIAMRVHARPQLN